VIKLDIDRIRLLKLEVNVDTICFRLESTLFFPSVFLAQSSFTVFFECDAGFLKHLTNASLPRAIETNTLKATTLSKFVVLQITVSVFNGLL